MNGDELADRMRRDLDANPPPESSGDPMQDRLDASIDQYEALIARKEAELEPPPPSLAEMVAAAFTANPEEGARS